MTLLTEWDLSVLYESFDDSHFKEDFSRAEQKADEWAQRMSAYPSGTEENVVRSLEEAILGLQDVLGSCDKILHFISLKLSADVTDQQALALQNREMVLRSGLKRLQSAFCRWVGGIRNLDQVIGSSALLEAHEFLLRESSREARHVLPEDLEPSVLRMQLHGGLAFGNLHDLLDGTHMVDMELDGNPASLPLSVVRGKAHDPDPAVREAAYRAELKSYEKIEIPMAACLNAIKGESRTLSDLRGYDSVLDEMLAGQRMDRSVLDVMVREMERCLPDFRRYLKAKARVLGHDNGLPFYDLFAPLGATSRRFTYDEAHAYLTDVLGRFSPKMAAFVDHAFRNRWIDALPRPGKGGGAFCAAIPSLRISRILTNFDGSFNSVSTLAHELGHAYHGECMRDESILNTDYPMPLAETASIFNEILVTRAALDEAAEDEVFAILDNELSEATQLIVDILSRYRFETAVLETVATRSLSVDELKRLMLDAQRSTYGEGLDPDAMHPYMWACKSHYYAVDLGFYNWPYAFGLLFGRGVYARYRKTGDSFLPEYDRLLIQSGQDSVTGAAASVGIDVREPTFWSASLDTIRESIDRFEEMAGRFSPPNSKTPHPG